MPRLVLIDGSSYLYRAFHALPPLSNDAGEPTGALFGVVNMLRATLKERPECVAFVLDASGPTFRDALDPEYKATRPPMPDELRAQVEPMCAIVEALGMPILRVEGVEADDVIGTLALQAAADGVEVTVSTSDKDMAQLVREGDPGRVLLVNTMSGSRLDSRQAVIDKFGVPPERIVDFLALVGDKVDNIPGVDKCGPKTAAKWLGEHGDLDGVIANAAAVGGKLGENLRAVLQRLPLNRQLATIRTDLPLDRRHDQLALRAPDVEALRRLYARYGFRQALRELQGGDGEDPGAAEAAAAGAGMRNTPAGYAKAAGQPAPAVDAALAGPGEYQTVLDPDALAAWIARLRAADAFAFDTETDSLDPMRANLVGLSLSVEPGRACYIPVGHAYPGAPAQLGREAVLEALRPLLEDAGKPKIGQHGKYDLHVLRRHGVDVAGYADDTMLESFVLNATATRHDMDSLAQRYLGYATVKYADVAGKGAKSISFDQVALDDATRYAAEDADVTLRLWRLLKPRLAEEGLVTVYETLERPLPAVLAEMERAGVRVDPDRLRRLSSEFGLRMAELEQRAHQLAGRPFNVGSPRQIGEILFGDMALPGGRKTASGQWGTEASVLEELALTHELPRVLLDWRQLSKLKGTYTDALVEAMDPATDRIHTSYQLAAASTGRLASSDPNLQNIPIRTETGRQIRQAFIPADGHVLISADYSQIELRLLAHIGDIPELKRAFAAGLDIHAATASEMFNVPLAEMDPETRRRAKAINFGIVYGISAFGLANQLGIDQGEAGAYIRTYFERFPCIRAYMDAMEARVRETGRVETLFGRRIHIPAILSKSAAERAFGERAAINAPIQGAAADIIRRAMVRMPGALEAAGLSGVKMLLQVHDELVFEAPEGQAEAAIAVIRRVMEGAAAPAVALSVPLVVDARAAGNWDEAH
ncbi:MAG: DNA polymerase I [Gammaproteobacteria bacterium]